MARHRLINCEFINASSFKVNVSNKAKLLYLSMLLNGDDRGFVDNTQELINSLTQNEKDFNNTISLDLLENSYNSALQELIDKGYLYEFTDNHKNKVHLIRHWFYHNKYKQGLWTNYKTFWEQVKLDNNEYVFGKKPLKENKLNQNKPNQDKLSREEKELKKEKVIPTEIRNIDDYLAYKGYTHPSQMSEEDKVEFDNLLVGEPVDIPQNEIEESDLPFPL